MRRLIIVFSCLALVACGEVSSGDPDGGGDDRVDASVDQPDACVESLRVSAQFMIDRINGTGASSLDQLLNHPNGFIITFNQFDTLKAADDGGGIGGPISFLHAVESDDWVMDYTGQDGDFLDQEVGQFLTRGLAVQDSIFQLGSDGRVFLYVLPDDTQMHPYMDLRCNDVDFEQDVGGYPIIETFTATGCSMIFFDFRPGIQKNITANQTVTFELTYNQCASP